MTTIAPCLWFDGKAEEAARFYVSLLPDSRIDSIVPYYFDAPGGKPGDVMMVEFTLAGQSYLALNGGAAFQFTPAVSLCVRAARIKPKSTACGTHCAMAARPAAAAG
jgi:predicted 3-demethylubiquinone-9 3-methyltransferase (glyoxalase superfamily)